MVALMRPVIDFLNELDKQNTEAKRSGTQSVFGKVVQESKETPLDKITKRASFMSPPVPALKKLEKVTQRICFERPKDQIKVVKTFA